MHKEIKEEKTLEMLYLCLYTGYAQQFCTRLSQQLQQNCKINPKNSRFRAVRPENAADIRLRGGILLNRFYAFQQDFKSS
jgi:hypothetical protein